MAERVELLLFGTPQVIQDGQLVRGFESRKAVALLCYLASRSTGIQPRQPIARTQLADLFWGDRTEAQGRSNLSHILNNLKTVVPNLIVADRNSIALAPEGIWLDLDAFEQGAASGTIEALTAAAALYRDEFLAGLYLNDCPEFEVWLVAEHERWRQRAVDVLEGVSTYHARRGDSVRALSFAARVLDLEPWRDEAHRHMMFLLVQTGQRSAALQQYEICRRVLAQEMGVEPGAETTALYQQIRSEAMLPGPQITPHNLPTQLTSFIGRESDLTRIAAALNNPDCRLLTLTGAGGIGKTRLAQEAAATLLASFRDGVFFVPLAPISAGRTEFIIPAIANVLGFSFVGSKEPKGQLLAYLSDKQMLWLLDNFEHLLEGRELVLEILQHAPQVKIIVTSREPLNVQAEWLTRVPGLSFPTMALENTDELLAYGAVQLFVERGGRVDEHFMLNEQSRASVLRICQSVEGMPLAIELAAAALRVLPIQEIANKIASSPDLMTPRQYDREARHGSLRAVLDWSYGLLTAPERKLFQRLQVFTGGWTPGEAAVQVCTDKEVSPVQVPQLLSHLISKSLVLVEEASGAPRYRMLEPIREYGRTRLAEANEVDLIRSRHLDLYVTLVEMAEPELEGPKRLDWFKRFEIEYVNLNAALEASLILHDQLEKGLRLAGALHQFWVWRSHIIEGRYWLDKLMAASRERGSGSTVLRAKMLFTAGGLAMQQTDYTEAGQLLEQSAMFYREIGDTRGLAHTQVWLGVETGRSGDDHLSRSLTGQGVALLREAGDRWGLAYALAFYGENHLTEGDYESARLALNESILLFQELGDRWSIEVPFIHLGRLMWREGDYRGARLNLDKGIAIARELDDRWGIAYILGLLGGLARAQGDYGRAGKLYEEGLVLLRMLGAKERVAGALVNLGRVAIYSDDFEQAILRFSEALNLISAYESNKIEKRVMADCLFGFAQIYAAKGNPARAAQFLGTFELSRDDIGLGHFPREWRADYDLSVAAVRSQLDGATFAAEWAQGRKMTIREAIECATSGLGGAPSA